MDPHDSFPFDFMDWLQGWRQQMTAIPDMLCWIEHPMSEDELHHLAALLERLVDDLEEHINKAFEEWREWQEDQKRRALDNLDRDGLEGLSMHDRVVLGRMR